MSQFIETKIQQLLFELNDFERVADSLLKEWDRGKLSAADKRSIAFYLVNTSLYPSLLDRITNQIQSDGAIDWQLFFHTLAFIEKNYSYKLEQKTITALREALEDKPPKNKVFISTETEVYDHFSEHCLDPEKLKLNLQNLYEEKVQETHDRLQFLKSQRLFDEEKKTLDLLKNLNPTSRSTHQNLWEDYKERWAYHILNLNQKTIVSQRAEQNLNIKWQDSMRELIEQIFLSASDQLKSNPQHSIDLAIMFYLMEFPKEALDILDRSEDSESKDWLKVELLLENRRFVDALEFIRILERKYASDPDMTFASSFARARAFWGLGQKATAQNLLRSILNVRPDYRHTHSLLLEWRDEDL